MALRQHSNLWEEAVQRVLSEWIVRLYTDCASPSYSRRPHESKAHKQFAIWVLTHLIGDIHQPLHAADHDDRGGNMIQVRLPWAAMPIFMEPGTRTSSSMPWADRTRSWWLTISS